MGGSSKERIGPLQGSDLGLIPRLSTKGKFMAISEKRREYLRLFGREWVAKRRAQWFLGKVCFLCGSMEGLEIHHTDPSQKESNSVWSWSEERRNEELKKCIVLCYRCHKSAHSKLVRELAAKTNIHGTKKMYSSVFACRCDLCKEAWRVYRVEERASKKYADPMYRRKIRSCPEPVEGASHAGL